MNAQFIEIVRFITNLNSDDTMSKMDQKNG